VTVTVTVPQPRSRSESSSESSSGRKPVYRTNFGRAHWREPLTEAGGGRMGDSDSDDDLFAPKAAATRVGRVVKPAEKYSARPAEATSARARMLSECDFLKEVGRARARPRPCARSPVPCRRSPPVGEALARRLTRWRL